MEKRFEGDGAITEEALAVMRSRIGVEHPAIPWNEYANRDAIWHFAEALGDDNPLWRDTEYARRSRWSTIIAPPTYLYSCWSGRTSGGLAGVFGLWSGDDWDWFQQLHVDERVHGTTHLAAVVEKRSQYAGRMIQLIQETNFFNEKGEHLGRDRQASMRMERHQARGKGKYTGIEKYRYTDQEIQAIEEAYLKEKRRGAITRYWEDVEVGEEIDPIVKGPLSVTSMVTWLMGWGSPLCKTDRVAHLFMHDHPGARIVDPETNVPDLPEASHWSESLARRSGLPGGYDIGGQRVSWMAHLMTDWMGDDGFLRKLDVRLRRPNLVGDTTWCRGNVANKRIRDGVYLVECNIWANNQRGERTTEGTAVVLLPSKMAGPVVVPTKVDI